MTARVFNWDYRQQPDMAAIAAAVTQMSAGRVFMREIDTGGDNYAWVISGAELTDEQAYRLYSCEDEEPAPEQRNSFPPDPPSCTWDEFHRDNPGLHPGTAATAAGEE